MGPGAESYYCPLVRDLLAPINKGVLHCAPALAFVIVKQCLAFAEWPFPADLVENVGRSLVHYKSFVWLFSTGLL